MHNIKLNFISAGKAQVLEPIKTQFGEVHRFLFGFSDYLKK